MIIYTEADILHHRRTKDIFLKFPKAKIMEIERYSHVFNRPKQDFRAQKQLGMRMILAKKREHFLHQVPECTTLSAEHNYYFAHLYNCPYDCEYCYLQGMYNSAFMVLFINFEDFVTEIKNLRMSLPLHEKITFFSGYDSDSLAMDKVTDFTSFFVPQIESIPNTEMELRTKSKNIESLLKMPTPKQSFVTYTISPENITRDHEKGTASLFERIGCLEQLIEHGWRVKIRFEPLIYSDTWEQDGEKLFILLNNYSILKNVEEVGIGLLRFPKDHFKKMKKILPRSKVLAQDFENKQGVMSYKTEVENQMNMFYETRSVKLWGREKVLVRVSD